MKILILGANGYIGKPLTLELLRQGFEVLGIDNSLREKRVEKVGGNSITPYSSMSYADPTVMDNEATYDTISGLINYFHPNVIVHLAQQPSAAYSMIDFNCCYDTYFNNKSTLSLAWALKEYPKIHLVKIGTMGEYGTPDCNIPEGFIPDNCEGNLCRYGGLPFPKSPGSFYHLTKVHDSDILRFASKTWGFPVSDIMQGIVYGLNYWDKDNEIQLTRFDYDECFGTVINRFMAEAVSGHPLTVYNLGEHVRSFLPLQDSIDCLIRIIKRPIERGSYEVYNQFGTVWRIKDLAYSVADAYSMLNSQNEVKISFISSPRTEDQIHYYSPSNDKLKKLGYTPTTDTKQTLFETMSILDRFKSRINHNLFYPKVQWR